MLAEYVALAQLSALNDWLLGQLVGDFTAADWRVKDAVGHTPRWILGHLATYRLRQEDLMGLAPVPADWTAAFARGTSDAAVPEGLDLERVVQAFHEAHRRMTGQWEHLTPEHLAQPAGRTLPDGSDTLGGALRFLVWHETYHLGQLGLLRRLAGKPGVA